MLFVVSAVLFDMLKARQLACVSKSGQKCPAAQSLSSRRAWIEIMSGESPSGACHGRSPHGERGLKFVATCAVAFRESRSPHGERGLKYLSVGLPDAAPGRSPHGERGLKSVGARQHVARLTVALLTESVD